ncbi:MULTISPECIES: FAD-dependent monooxygenase [Streptosporangium]|uniref:2-polyprenyl-6-methoxyphenol hydroxylase-like FAD-dependent oxidoreductase n=1 Tax=Streptosporangium brasiliense TaxID=47480 RepID=A0ABT9RDT6_9ACTN|nr:FAD-dependent monooxygenase [Streptosporangium brasiliense]MDP9867421.1 2-polyprenyl-6-methoxyphenol hydroxylase-like FAD-dependent oxidoreductase [Streptosporangium brasiliense]
MTDVIIVGGGPVGLLLACELTLAGADALVLEAASDEDRRTRSLGLRSLNARTLRSLALRGLTGPLAEAQQAMFDELSGDGGSGDGVAGGPSAQADVVALMVEVVQKGMIRGHFSGLPLLEPAGGAEYLMLKQHRLESVLATRAAELGVTVRQGCGVTEVTQDGTGVAATLADGRVVRGSYLVGCDGGRSVVRKRSGFAFSGTPATMTGRTAEAELADPGAITSSLRGPGGLVNLSLVPGEIATVEFDGGPGDRDAPVTAPELQESLRRVTGIDVVVTRLETGIRYGDNTRHADTYRKGRVLLAGDAAHVHSPIGGQGLNLGLQDALNLGWKLALVARGLAPDSLLDTYTAERHPVAARVLRDTRAQVALMRPGAQVDALREVLAEVLELPDARRHFAAMVEGTDVDYAPGAAGPLVGRFVPPLGETAPVGPLGGQARSAAVPADGLLTDGRGLLVGAPGESWPGEAVAGHRDRVRAVVAQAATDTGALLVRPDGYVAWAGGRDSLGETLAAWFGPAR